MIKSIILLLHFLFIILTAYGSDSTEIDKSKRLHLYPFAFYTKETSISLGGAGLLYFRPKNYKHQQSHASSIQVTSDYSFNKQFNLEIWYQLFLNSDKYRWQGFIDFNNYSYYYYGIGINTVDSNKEHYRTEFTRQRTLLLRKFYKGLFMGFKYWSEYYQLKGISDKGELKNHPKMGFISSLGPALNYDTRDNVFYPRKGMYWEISYQISSSLIGSNYPYKVLINDFRMFFCLKRTLIIAFQNYLQSMSGNPPFNQLALLGGHRRMRGYYLGRYRDNNMIVFQSEIRGKISNRWGAAFFGGIGSVYPKFNQVDLSGIERSIGAGIRYKLSKNEMTNIRLDFAVGKMGNKGLYFVIDEAF